MTPAEQLLHTGHAGTHRQGHVSAGPLTQPATAAGHVTRRLAIQLRYGLWLTRTELGSAGLGWFASLGNTMRSSRVTRHQGVDLRKLQTENRLRSPLCFHANSSPSCRTPAPLRLALAAPVTSLAFLVLPGELRLVRLKHPASVSFLSGSLLGADNQ